MGSACSGRFPITEDGIPILLNEEKSVFRIADYFERSGTFFGEKPQSRTWKTLTGLVPTIGGSVNSEERCGDFIELLLSRSPSPRVLVVGGGILGSGLGALVDHPAVTLIDTDVAFGPGTMLICDGHDLPFQDESFDAAVIQAVLEHVADPYRCVHEIHRVLTGDGLVYAETPFIQQVHGGPYDFTRFTLLGHRRLFRWFDEIESGASCGPGMALAWSYQYFLTSFWESRIARAVAAAFANMTAFWLKYFDRILVGRRGALDGASAYYFIGSKTDRPVSDRKLISQFRGVGGTRFH